MMRFAPEMQMMRERMPMIRERIAPIIRERMRDLPNRIQFRTMPDDEPFELENDLPPFEFENTIETVSPVVLREMAATTVRDAGVALKQLAAAGIA